MDSAKLAVPDAPRTSWLARREGPQSPRCWRAAPLLPGLGPWLWLRISCLPREHGSCRHGAGQLHPSTGRPQGHHRQSGAAQTQAAPRPPSCSVASGDCQSQCFSAFSISQTSEITKRIFRTPVDLSIIYYFAKHNEKRWLSPFPFAPIPQNMTHVWPALSMVFTVRSAQKGAHVIMVEHLGAPRGSGQDPGVREGSKRQGLSEKNMV